MYMAIRNFTSRLYSGVIIVTTKIFNSFFFEQIKQNYLILKVHMIFTLEKHKKKTINQKSNRCK